MTTMRESFDVTVVGAGPCGSFSALAAAKRGANVSVIEEHLEVGVPSHCAGHISIHGLKTLGLDIPVDLIENEVRTAIFHSPSGRTLRIECASPVTYVINRTLFDQYLAELATRAGVSYLKGVRAESLWMDSGHIRGISARAERQLQVEAKVVVDAEGVHAWLLKKAHLPTPREEATVIGAQGYSARMFDIEPKSVEIYLGSRYAPGFFAWIIPRQDGGAKIGLAANRGNPRILLEQFVTRHPVASRKILEPLTDVSFHPIPLGGPPLGTYADNLLVVGDAASQVKPTTGGGVVFGLTCSRIAGDVAADGVASGDCSSHVLSKYQESWREMLGREFTIGRLTRRTLSGLSDSAVDRIFWIGRKFHVEDSIGYVTEIDFEETILRNSLRKPNVALALLCSLLSCLLP